MSDRIFLDTNVLVYVHSKTEPTKRQIIEKVIEQNDHLMISTQVINEFINVMHKKRNISFESLLPIIRELRETFTIAQISTQTIEQALNIAAQHNYSYFDSLMLSAAIENSCSLFYTEDMHHGHKIGALRIQNPFK